MKIIQALSFSKKELRNHNIPSYQIDSLILLCHCLKQSKEYVIFNPDIILNQDQLDQFHLLIKRRSNKEPISHIIGKREFFGKEFIVNSKVLDPRCDSEILIEAVLEKFKDKSSDLNMLELGSGSGCLILTLLDIFHNSKAVAVDIQKDALEIARQNSQKLNLENHIQFIQSNWFDRLDPEEKFDLIISNPPYIKSQDIQNLQIEVKDYEPLIALDGGEDGLECYRLIAKNISRFLKKNALLILEIGQNQENDVIAIFKNQGLEFITQRKDLANIVRCLVFRNNPINSLG